MRIASALLITSLAMSGANAADYLRGAIPSEMPRPTQSATYDWSGFYFGGHGMYQAGTLDQSKLGTNLGAAAYPNLEVATPVGQMLTFGKPSARGAGFGIFAGYSTMWDDVVLGVETEYNRGALSASSSVGPYGRAFSAAAATTDHWETTISGTARSKVEDYGVARFRVGVAYDRFMPFITLGAAAGRLSANASTTGQTQYYQLQPITDSLGNITGYTRINLSGIIPGNAQTKNRGFQWGYALGAGMDVAVTDNVFLRGHWEYLAFGGPNGAQTGIHAVKGGAGLKF